MNRSTVWSLSNTFYRSASSVREGRKQYSLQTWGTGSNFSKCKADCIRCFYQLQCSCSSTSAPRLVISICRAKPHCINCTVLWWLIAAWEWNIIHLIQNLLSLGHIWQKQLRDLALFFFATCSKLVPSALEGSSTGFSVQNQASGKTQGWFSYCKSIVTLVGL